MQRLPYKLAQNDLEFILCELSGRLKKKKIINYLARQDNPDYMKIAKYLNDNKVNVFPYKFTEQYKASDISIKKDKTSNLYFTNYHNFDIYLKPAFTNKYRAARYFKNILLEQNTQSPHRYTTEEFHPQKDSVILDIGGAEGFFPIDYIDAVKKVYIFECSNEWIQALKKTYKNYKDKVVIIKKFVSSYSDDTHISLDDFIKEKHLENDNLFIKIDAEGSEPDIIKGGSFLFSSKQSIQLALCVYHCAWHEKYFRKLFHNWNICSSNGYMLYYYDFYFSEPYVRTGVLRIWN